MGSTTEEPRPGGRGKAERVALPDDRYIPVQCRDLVDALAADREHFEAVSDRISELADALERIIDQETGAFERVLLRRYERFDPARETVVVHDGGDEQVEDLRGLVAYLLDKANYEPLDVQQVETTLARTSHGIRIRVDPARMESIDLYVRGQTQGQMRIRTIRRPVRGEVRRVELFRRLAVVFRERGSAHLNLKLFREIPTADVEALLPHAEVEMTSWDRIKVLGYGMGALGGLATKGISVFVEGTIAAGQFLWAGILALVGLSMRSILGYRRAKHVRASQMTHNLYYQNVANNAGVLSSLLANIAAEELKEAVLAYAVLAGPHACREVDQLDAAVENWLRDRFDVAVDFDGIDAIETLDRLELWEDRGALRVLPPSEAIARLEAHWTARRSEGYHLDVWRRAGEH